MQKIALTIFGGLLISGSVVQMAAASEHHRQLSKASFSRHLSDYRGAYNQVNGPINGSATGPSVQQDLSIYSEGYMSSGPAGH